MRLYWKDNFEFDLKWQFSRGLKIFVFSNFLMFYLKKKFYILFFYLDIY